MVIFWTILSVVILFLLMCALLVHVNAREVERYAARLEEAMWTRRNKMPLLLEVAAPSGNIQVLRKEIIDLTEKASSKSYSLADKVAMEKILTNHLSELFRNGQKVTDALFISLREEVAKSLTEMKIVLHEYNTAIEKCNSRMTLPWFKIFRFLGKNVPNSRLEEL